MKNDKTCSTLFTSSLFYRSMFVIMLVVIIIISGCHSEEKKQRAKLQAIDTLDKETHQTYTSEMRTVFPGGDTIQQSCMFSQDAAEVLLEEYYRQGTKAERLRQIIVELENLEQECKQMDCRQVFG